MVEAKFSTKDEYSGNLTVTARTAVVPSMAMHPSEPAVLRNHLTAAKQLLQCEGSLLWRTYLLTP